MFDKLFAVCLLVDDFDKSLAFYRNTLGLMVNVHEDGFANFHLGETEFAIFQKDAAAAMFPATFMKPSGGVVIGFQVDNLDDSCKALTDKGVTFFEGPKTTDWGQKVAYLHDPDGNILEISEKMKSTDESYEGTIIEESLIDKSILQDIQITETHVEKVTPRHKTPWLKQWTLHRIRVSANQADTLAKKLSRALGKNHWYADYRTSSTHYIIFPDKIFRIDRSKPEQYEVAKKHGASLNIPEYQLDFDEATETTD